MENLIIHYARAQRRNAAWKKNGLTNFLHGGVAWLSLLLLLLSMPHSAAGQFFPAGNTPCPFGPGVKLDTVTFLPSAALPFDRCFFLQYSLPKDQEVVYCIVMPVDKYGRLKISRHDRYVFLRSGWPRGKARRDARRANPLREFKKGKVLRQIMPTKNLVHGGKRDLYFKIPPLDPGREYRFTFVANDREVASQLLKVADAVQPSGSALSVNQSPVKDLDELFKKGQYNDSKFNDMLTRDTRSTLDYLISVSGLNLTIPLPTYTTSSCQSCKEQKVEKKDKKAKTGGIDLVKIFLVNANDPIPKECDLTTLPPTYYATFDPSGSCQWVIKPQQDTTSGTFTLLSGPQGNAVPDAAVRSANAIQVSAKDGPKKYQVVALSYFHRSKLHRFFSKTPCVKAEKVGDVTFTVKDTLLTVSSEKIKVDAPLIAKYPRLKVKASNDKSVTDDDLRGVIRYASTDTTCSACPSSRKRDDLVTTLLLFSEKNQLLLCEVSIGIRALPDLEPVAAEDKTAELQANLKKSRAQLLTALEFIRRVEVARASQAATRLRSQFEALLTILSDNEKSLKDYDKNIASLQDQVISDERLLKQANATFGTPSSLSLETDTKLSIIPNFGYSVVFGGNFKPFVTDFVPTVGFSLGTRGIDKNVSFRMIRYMSLRHRLTFTTSLSVTSLAVTNKREDLLGKFSLLVGGGLRLSHVIQLTSGVVLLKAYDPNPLSERRPLRVTPYAGLLIDLDLRNLFGGIGAQAAIK